jgi:hypothetical protein
MVMSFRARFAVIAGGWIVVVAAALVAMLAGSRGRLPEPLASHWGPSGSPDDSMPFFAFAAIALSIWSVVAGVAMGTSLTGQRWQRRPVRAWAGAGLAAGGTFVVGLAGVTVWANLDASDWRAARSVNWQVILVIAAAGAAGWLGWRLARRGPHLPPGPPGKPVRPLELRPGEHAVWVSTAVNSSLLGVGAVLLALAVALAVGTAFGLPGLTWYVSAVLVVVTLACLAVSSIRVEVNQRGLTVAYGAWRWPRRRTPLGNIRQAWTEQRRPSEVGGWGYRGLPGKATIMIRGGECLVIGYQSGGQLRISVDDAERGAALLNAFIRPVA